MHNKITRHHICGELRYHTAITSFDKYLGALKRVGRYVRNLRHWARGGAAARPESSHTGRHRASRLRGLRAVARDLELPHSATLHRSTLVNTSRRVRDPIQPENLLNQASLDNFKFLIRT